MKKFGGADKAKESAKYTGGAKLPVGAYVCTILGAKFKEDMNKVEIQFDIAEGEHKDFFQTQYKNNPSEDKKYKGRTSIWYPKDDGTEQDEWTKTAFMRYVNAIEDSNYGYTWDWDETKWKGKKIGLVFGETGAVIGDKPTEFVEVHGCASVKSVKEGTFSQKLLDFKARNGYWDAKNAAAKKESAKDDFISVGNSDIEELPFD